MKTITRFNSMSRLSSGFVHATLVLSALLMPAGPAAAAIEEWVARYNGPGNFYEQANAMAVDKDGNVYVTGHSFGSTNTYYDYATVKYDPNGNVAWVARFDPGGQSYPTAIAVDGSGNVYVTGTAYASIDYATVKYDPNGHQLWVARYNGPGKLVDWACAMAVDASGNIYVTGYSYGSGTSRDYATIKYDPNGHQLWVARYNGPGNSDDAAYAMAVDAGGNVYVTGHSVGSTATDYDYATIKYGPNGNQLWVARYNGPASSFDGASAIAVGATGDVYVTGSSTGSGTSRDYATIKYGPNGNQLWVARYNGPGNRLDGTSAIALDASGNAYVTGFSTGSGTLQDYATVKYGPNGNQLWVARYNGPGNSNNAAHAIAVDKDGDVYVTGQSTGLRTRNDYATIQYDPNGNQLWVARYNGPGNSSDIATALAVDQDGNVYVTGGSAGSGTSTDYATIKYKQTPALAELAAGNRHSCARLTDGSAPCWGDNGYGRLGHGNLVGSPIPVPMSGINVASATNSACEPYVEAGRLIMRIRNILTQSRQRLELGQRGVASRGAVSLLKISVSMTRNCEKGMGFS